MLYYVRVVESTYFMEVVMATQKEAGQLVPPTDTAVRIIEAQAAVNAAVADVARLETQLRNARAEEKRARAAAHRAAYGG